MNEYAISVIIPVYNGEKYLNKCLNSVINQTMFKKMQIIVVNDGSTDNTLCILREYEKQYDNMTIIDIPNGGVSNARNVGIKNALGEYVTFVDADDWVDCECYEKMYKKARESSTDIVAAGFFVSTDNEDILKNCVTNQEIRKTKSDAVYDFLIGNIDVHCSNKIFLKKIVEKIRFDTNFKIAEDRLFLFEMLLMAETVYLIPDVFYHYYQNTNSVMHNDNVGLSMDGVKVAQKILDKTKKQIPDLRAYAEAMYISTACRTYCELASKKYKDTKNYEKLRNDIKQYTLIKGARYMSKKHFVALFLAKISPKLFNRLRSNTFIRLKK